MKNKLINIAMFIGFYILSISLYQLFWNLVGQDVINRFGYEIWLRWSAEKSHNQIRIIFFRIYFESFLPCLVGLVGAYWLNRLMQTRFGRKIRALVIHRDRLRGSGLPESAQYPR